MTFDLLGTIVLKYFVLSGALLAAASSVCPAATYVDDGVIEEKSVAPLMPLLKHIDTIADKEVLAQLLGDDVCADVDPLNVSVFSSHRLIGLAVQRGIHGETVHFAYLVQGGLGMPEVADYIDKSPQKENLREQYRNYIADMLTLSGFDHATERSKRVLALEVEIARHNTTVDSVPLDTWKDYLRFHIVDRYADVLPRTFSDRAFLMRTAWGSKKTRY